MGLSPAWVCRDRLGSAACLICCCYSSRHWTLKSSLDASHVISIHHPPDSSRELLAPPPSPSCSPFFPGGPARALRAAPSTGCRALCWNLGKRGLGRGVVTEGQAEVWARMQGVDRLNVGWGPCAENCRGALAWALESQKAERPLPAQGLLKGLLPPWPLPASQLED